MIKAQAEEKGEKIGIDSIAAVVNDEIITLSDIDKAIQFYPILRKSSQSEQDYYLDVLQDLINYKAVYLEYKDEIELQEEDFQELQTAIIKKTGSYNTLLIVLARFDMQWVDFKSFITEKAVYEKVIKKKFQIAVSIGQEDVEAFYNDQYIPLQQKLGLEPRPLSEMESVIHSQLIQERTDEKIKDWLKDLSAIYVIDNKLIKEQESL